MAPAIIQTSHLFAPLHRELIALLHSLDEGQWHAPTVAGQWRVRDVAAHLLQGDLQRLSADRDGYIVPTANPLNTYDDVLNLINTSNRDSVAAMRRFSPHVLMDLLEWSGTEFSAFVAIRDPHGPALYPVAWAESESLYWMDLGREYTERWHHQQQIRDAVGAPLLLAREWAEPMFELSVRALPHAYGGVFAEDGAAVVLRVDPFAWSLVRRDDAWELESGMATSPAAEIIASADDAWRIFFNALSPDEALSRIQVNGDSALAYPFLRARAVMV